MLSWFDANPDRHWWVVCVVTAGSLFLLLRPVVKPRPDWSDFQCPDWRWGLIILLLLCAGRWPTWFVPRQFSEDEGQLIAGAITLHHDPVFWRSVDGGTVGPLDYFALLPVGWLHGTDDFASARITALILIAAALIFTHQSLSLVFGRQVARIATFSAVCMESFTLDVDLVHYSTELLPIALLAFGFCAGTRRFVTHASRRWTLAGGLALGAVPFAKLQAGPAALLLGLGWVAGEIGATDNSLESRRGNLTGLCAAALAPLTISAIILTTTGQWKNALIPYILNNISYVNSTELSLPNSLAILWRDATNPGTLMAAWMAGCGLWLLLTLPISREAGRATRRMASVAVGFLLISLATVLIPHRPFIHYFQFLVVPGTLVFGAVIGLAAGTTKTQPATRRGALFCAALLCSTGPLMYDRAGVFHPIVGSLTYFQMHPRGIVAGELLKYSTPGEAVAVWGWMDSCYAEAGLRQATRDANSLYAIMPGKYREYFQRRFLTDFEHSSPPLFVDAAARKESYFSDPRMTHDQIFPAFAAIIRKQYTQVADMGGARIYVRNDRLALIESQSAGPHSH